MRKRRRMLVELKIGIPKPNMGGGFRLEFRV